MVAQALAREDTTGGLLLAAILSVVRSQRGTRGLRKKTVDMIFSDGDWTFVDVIRPPERFGRQRK